MMMKIASFIYLKPCSAVQPLTGQTGDTMISFMDRGGNGKSHLSTLSNKIKAARLRISNGTFRRGKKV
jgi:GH24 family phage-related lysozyme (muramidase)